MRGMRLPRFKLRTLLIAIALLSIPMGWVAYPAALSIPTQVPIDIGPGRHSNCQPRRTIIGAKQAQRLSAKRIHQDLVSEHAAVVSYDSVRRFLRRLA